MILITGANGRPGSAVVREFARRGTPVRALVRDKTKAEELVGLPGVDVALGDMSEPDTLQHALDGVERLLMISSAGPQMLETQCTFIDAAKRAGVGHIVKFSGHSPVGFDAEKFRSTRSHEQIQRYLIGSGPDWTILRPDQFMQVYFEEVPDIVAHGELRLPLGDTRLTPIDIEDIARIAYRVLTTDGHQSMTYVMTGPEALTMDDVAKCIADATGAPVRYVDVPGEAKFEQWQAAGFPQVRARAFTQLFDERRRMRTAAVDLTSHRRFGVQPTTFAEFARRHASVFRGVADYTTTPPGVK